MLTVQRSVTGQLVWVQVAEDDASLPKVSSLLTLLKESMMTQTPVAEQPLDRSAAARLFGSILVQHATRILQVRASCYVVTQHSMLHALQADNRGSETLHIQAE